MTRIPESNRGPLCRVARSLALGLALVGTSSTIAHGAKAPPPRPAGPTPAEATHRLLGEALATDGAYDALGELCDKVGNRFSGSPQLDKAIAWAQAHMKADGLANVHAEPVMVPVWVRGVEHAELVAPVARPLSLLGLGMSVGTPPGGITADALVVSSFEEMEKLGEARVKGRIVVFDVPFTGYGETVKYRGVGASMAAKLGAVAVLIRSIGPISYDTPHTGSLHYLPGIPQIPAAALTIEDASALHRIAARGETPRIRLEMGAKQLPDAPSANVVGEWVGREHPEEIVLLGAHLDSWDVGQGAQDDGAGVVEVMEAAHLMQKLGLRPRRTVRVVLFTNEENGLRGGKAYRDAHLAELPKHVAVLESDSGSGPALGFNFDIRPKGAPQSFPPPPPSPEMAAKTKALEAEVGPRLSALAPFLEPLDAGAIKAGHSGADLEAMMTEGVLGLGYEHDWSRYFDVHHTRADTFDKVDRKVLRRNVAALAIMAWLLAEVY